jgi:hypothetical protein
MGPGETFASFLFFVTVITLVSIFTHHARKMAEIRAGAPQNPQLPVEGLEAMRQEFLTLREGITSHAMSVDRRLESMEARFKQLEAQTSAGQDVHHRLGGAGG